MNNNYLKAVTLTPPATDDGPVIQTEQFIFFNDRVLLSIEVAALNARVAYLRSPHDSAPTLSVWRRTRKVDDVVRTHTRLPCTEIGEPVDDK